jgi:hypothetical protein
LCGFTWMLQVLTPEPESPEGSTPESEADSNPKRNFTPPQGENPSEDSMKKAFLLIVLPALLTLGFAQTPAPSANTDQTTIKGCLGGSDGNYTVVEDNTGHIFKITTVSVDLKPHLGHEVALIGHNASGVSSAPADNNFAVTELNMISEHCAGAAAASAATVSTPSETPGTPPAAVTAPAATISPLPETVATPAADATPPAETAATPVAAATPPAEIPVTPAAAVAAPVATVNMPSETASKPAARPRRPSQTPAAATPVPAATVSSSSEPASTRATAAITPAPIASTSTDPVSTPAAVATTPAATSRGWSLWLWIAFAVLVIVIGTLFPFFSRWKKQKRLERTGAPNLSFTREVSSDQGKSDRQGPRKAA